MSGVFETMRAVVDADGARVPLLPFHLERLARSARCLGLRCPDGSALRSSVAAAIARARADLIVRIDVDASASPPRVVTRPLLAAAGPLVLWLAPEPARPHAVSADHKGSDRAHWDRLEAVAREQGADEPLTLREDGTLGETARGNLFVEIAGRIATPPLDGSILPGVARALLCAALRAQGMGVAERPIGRGELDRARLWSSNAVHGPRPARLCGLAGGVRGGEDVLGRAWASVNELAGCRARADRFQRDPGKRR